MDLIEKNYKFSQILKECFFKEKNINIKLKLAKYYATYCWQNRVGFFQDLNFEKELGKISLKYEINTFEIKNTCNGRTLHIATEVYSSGGHTRVINNWINFEKKDQDLLIINSEKSQIESWLKKTLKESAGKIILLQQNSVLEKAKELFNIAQNYKRIILHIHPNDIIPILAFSNSSIIEKIYFYNHADHTFWLGVTINKCVLDLTSKGKELSLKKRGIINSEILSIPLEEKSSRNKVVDSNKIYELYNIEKNNKIIFSMATERKYNTILDYNFFEFLKELSSFLIKYDIYFLIAGPNLKSKSWKKIYEYSEKRVIPLGALSKEKVKEIWEIVDLYIDSFPMNSYTCLLEAIANNIKCFSLKTPTPDLDCLKKIKINTIEELIEETKKFFLHKNSYKEENIEINSELKKIHFKDGFLNNLKKIYLKNDNKKIVNCRLINIFFNDDYENFFINQKNKLLFLNRNSVYFNFLRFLRNGDILIFIKTLYFLFKKGKNE